MLIHFHDQCFYVCLYMALLTFTMFAVAYWKHIKQQIRLKCS